MGAATATTTTASALGYPSLTKEALGALKFAWRLAHVEDDWSKGGRVSDAWDRWTGWPTMAKLTYDLTYAIRLLAKVSQEIPAWREICAESAELLCDRMRHYVSWSDWVDQKGLDPNRGSYPFIYYKHLIPPGYAGVYNAPGYAGNGLSTGMDGLMPSFLWGPVTPRPDHPYVHQHSPGVGRTYDPDPVYGNGSSNLMYKGYYLEQLGHCRVISGDPKWDEKLELIYDEDIRYSYTVEEIASTMFEQHRAATDTQGSSLRYGIDCEVGKAFPVCIGVGGLGLLLHDQTHGTSYADAYREWLEFGKANFIAGPDPNGPIDWFCTYYDRDLNYNMNKPENQLPAIWLIAALQFAVFDRPYAERIYEGCLHRFGRLEPDGGMRVLMPKEIVGDAVLDDTWAVCAALACAHEFGDTTRLDQLMTYHQNRYEPTFHDGEFYYQFGIREPWPRGIPNHWAQLAFLSGPGSVTRMYQEPNLKKFDQPTVHGVDFPNVTVSQAFFDETTGTLAIGITPGQDSAPLGSPTTFRVKNLPAAPTVLVDGAASDAWTSVGPGEIAITTTVADHTFLIS